MRVSWKWLKELVEINLEPAELGSLMTMSGIEVEGIEPLQKGVRGVKAGLLRGISRHPEADKLFVCTLDVGEGKEYTVVTGATNLQAGMKVPVALPGAQLPGGKHIESTFFRGIESAGMLCSAQELGLDTDKLTNELKEGIFILPADTAIGRDVVYELGLDDVVLELGLTPNRSDCLGMLNVAREVAALTGGKLKFPHIEASRENGSCAGLIRVDIDNPELCRRYVARVLTDVKIAPSPLWMQLRLMAAGMRPINNIVDVTNYVMMEMGQPLHAFDCDKVRGRHIIVRQAAGGEELVTLDGQSRKLQPEMLVIADEAGAIALAGVMGGLDSEITAATKNILLESACFNGANIRRTSLALGLRSEASLRFEKSAEAEQCAMAADRAIQLMTELGAGKPVEGRVDRYVNPVVRKPIRLRTKKVSEVLGITIDNDTIQKVLLALQIRIVERDPDGYLVETPSYRPDLEGEIDLIEEIARLHGFDKIPTTLPYGATVQGARTREQNMRETVRKILEAQGLYEVITYSFINPRHLDWLRIPIEHPLRQTVVVKNPLSEEQGIMRTTLLPGLLDTVARNLNKRNKNFRLYELGKIYLAEGFPENPLPAEKSTIGAVAVGNKEKTWVSPTEEYDFYHLKGVMERVLERLQIKGIFVPNKQIPWFHPGKSASLLINGKEAGFLGEIHPLVLEKYGIEQRTTGCIMDMDTLYQEASQDIYYRPIPRYPSVTRDLAVVLPENVAASDVARMIEKIGQGRLHGIRLFDLYRGKQVENGYKSLAFSLTWAAEDKTLTDDEVNLLHQEIERALAQDLGAGLRRL